MFIINQGKIGPLFWSSLCLLSLELASSSRGMAGGAGGGGLVGGGGGGSVVYSLFS